MVLIMPGLSIIHSNNFRIFYEKNLELIPLFDVGDVVNVEDDPTYGIMQSNCTIHLSMEEGHS